ncbi:MAG: FHA domain-containing protein [Myxococcota bacterium]
MLKLLISDDEGQTTVVPLLRDEITIGRRAGNTIRLTERNVSRTHARLVKRDEAYIVEDLGSYNGVILNGQRVNTSAQMAPGDQLAIGDYAIALQAETRTSRRPPAPVVDAKPPPRLVVLNEPAAGAEFSLSKPVMRIGRDERLDIWINHKSISHEHAEVQVVDGVVTVFDLDSVNGMRVNGIDTTRAMLESGDVLQLGEVGFRLLTPQGTLSLQEVPPSPAVVPNPTPAAKKPLFALAVLGLLALFGGLTVMATIQDPADTTDDQPTALASSTGAIGSAPTDPAAASAIAAPSEPTEMAMPDEADALRAEDDQGDAPQEWEDHLARARRQLARGKVDEAYRVANELPEDSVLRRTPEFGEIRYRYVQSHVDAAEEAMEAGQPNLARREAKLALAIPGMTSKQKRDARRIVSATRRPSSGKPSPEESLAEAYRCVGTGDNACVILALEGGQAKTPAALALLIETYRAMDDFSAARRHMRAFVQRYPEDARAPRYREMLAAD